MYILYIISRFSYYVLGMFTSNGDLNPSNKKKVTWGIIQALLALALLMSGGLETLQTVSIVSAFPFSYNNDSECSIDNKALKTEFKVENEVKKNL
ncbi:BCCT family transporter [Paraclostridium bifermentans]|nr:BCCT family transporter [Paraclostridium bifermentans]